MQLEGSCRCRAVTFTVESYPPQPYMCCYCSICRKTAGSGGFAINLGADYRTLKATGRRSIGIYRAMGDSGESLLQRRFPGPRVSWT